VENTSGPRTPIIGFSMFDTTSNTTSYFLMGPKPVKHEVVLSEMSSLEGVWYDFLGCVWCMISFAVCLVQFIVTPLVLFICYWRERSRQKYKVEDGLLKCTKADHREKTTATFENPNSGVERQSIEVEVEMHGQHSGEVGDQQDHALEYDRESRLTESDPWRETNTIGPSCIILLNPTDLKSRDPSQYGSTSTTTSSGLALHSDVNSSSSSSRFSAIEDTNTDVQPPPFARLVRSVFEVVSQQERETPDGGNA
jgi:hypothetical protein